MAIAVKMLLEEQDDVQSEKRCFVASDEMCRKFNPFHEKTLSLFPSLTGKRFSLQWKDKEGDLISISSDEELAYAISNVESGTLNVYIRVQAFDRVLQQSSLHPNIGGSLHPNIVCDGCHKLVIGPRFKCLQCSNYDLCNSCHQIDIHPNHDMLKLISPQSLSEMPWVASSVAWNLWDLLTGNKSS